jgi:hypothetical protein
MKYARWYPSAIPLPNNTILIVAGTDQDASVGPDPLAADKGRQGIVQTDEAFSATRVTQVVPEIYDPRTDRTIPLEKANNNGGQGITLTDSQVLLLAFPPAQGSSITANGNRANGILVGTNASLSLFGDPGANAVTAMNNTASGILITGGQILSRRGTARFVIEGNQVGITLDTDGNASIQGGLSIRNNVTGVLADGAGVFAVESAPVPSAITNNTNWDFDARFGSRVRLLGVSVGPKVACDPTVLRQGLACP